MRTVIVVLALLMTAVSAAADDRRAIEAAALDYAEGWYAGDADRMARALHPDLAKRIVASKDGEPRLQHMTAEQLIAGTRKGYGKNVPPEKQLKDVKILDVFGNTATVRLEMAGWIDYLHV
ncbi:MAG TPA: nuclear transport factor 2 family protein, partial [Thermoanaerobaculia bacterium]|nr:nuclear transport factor 2 family protein [Thermoanaerobaculia bacterium]